MSRNVILGIDGGGTYTRVAITSTEGILLSYVESKGAASIYKDLNAKVNVCNAIQEVVNQANCKLEDIVGLAAGVAGLDNDSDLEWVRELTHIDGLECSSQHVNDAVIAHKGAFLSKPGIIAISGTGSIIFGITESGKYIRNYNFHHYAATAARFLSYDTVYKIIAGETDRTDSELVEQVLKHFKVKDLAELAQLGSEGFVEDSRDRNKQFGDLAPVITDAALRGSHLAIEICNQAATAIITGVKLIGSCFDSETVAVALIGSVVNSVYIKNTINELINIQAYKKYNVIEPALPAVLGAITMAMEQKGIALNETVQNNLVKSAAAIFQTCHETIS
ncbi:MAG: hypothetical protein A2Y17_05110 [Clostridiales bacterium GWF2_38_85]|nr:MAG: hypothetical protein A2Y17_05110 [Clostridiales bacterium GWF2_38_85]HBL84838.1 ATPase [Clostridiales bacterium]